MPVSEPTSEFKSDWVSQYLGRDPRTIIDAGCRHGDDALVFKRKWPEARVIAIEACPANYSAMAAAPEAAPLEIYHLAIGGRVGTRDFRSVIDEHVPGGVGVSGSVLEPASRLLKECPHLHFTGPMLVPCTTLEAFCTARGVDDLDLLHMDIQAAEGEALVGLGELRPPMIYLEVGETERYIGAVSREEAARWLVSKGYQRMEQLLYDELYILKP